MILQSRLFYYAVNLKTFRKGEDEENDEEKETDEEEIAEDNFDI